MMERQVTEDAATAIWYILTLHAGAEDNGWMKDNFVYLQSDPDTRVDEFRFGGGLGFGGKFWVDRRKWYVNCYKEDLTPEREAMIEATNQALKELRTFFP